MLKNIWLISLISIFIVFSGTCILMAEDNDVTIIPQGVLNTNSEQTQDANSWITTQLIGAAPGMDQYNCTGVDVIWTHTFTVPCKDIYSVELTIMANDVDYNQGERDGVYINGISFGYLAGGDGEEFTATVIHLDPQFVIDAHGILDVLVKIDETNGNWCCAIDWSRLQTHWDYSRNKVSGFVFCDANANGIMDGDENGISNVVLRLFNKFDPQPDEVPKALTDASGYYRFVNICGNEYVVTVDEYSLPDNAASTTGGQTQEVPLPLRSHHYKDINFGYQNTTGAECFWSGKGSVVPPMPAGKSGNDLVFIRGTQTFGGGDYSWHNAVDGDYEGWDGTTLARGDRNPRSAASAVFQFADGGMYKFNYVAFQTDNGTDDDTERYDYQAILMQVLVSTTGTEDSDFTLIANIKRKYDGTGLEWHNLGQYITAKYVMLKILTPNHYYGAWRQLVEFEVQDGSTKRGASLASSETYDVMALPETTVLSEAYPNPFNPQTTIPYQLGNDSKVTIQVFDLIGRQVETLVDEFQYAGHHQITWNAVYMPSGNYFIVMRTGNNVQMKKVLLLK